MKEVKEVPQQQEHLPMPNTTTLHGGKRQTPLAKLFEKIPLAEPRKIYIKNHFVAAVGEYVGTTLFLFFAFGGTSIANIPSVSITGGVNTSQLLYIALCFGFSLAVCAWVFFRVSGGLFNPAVSLGLALVGAITPDRAVILTFAQILGGITAAALIQALLPGNINCRTTLSEGMSIAQGLFLEMFLTSMLMLTILLLAAEKHKATFLAPIGIGLSLFIAELCGVYWTGGSLNPARSFGPDVVLRTFDGYHYLYWIGPALGATLAAGFYKFIKFFEYETVAPDQDGAQDISTQLDPINNTGEEPATMTAVNITTGESLGMMSRRDYSPKAPLIVKRVSGTGESLEQNDDVMMIPRTQSMRARQAYSRTQSQASNGDNNYRRLEEKLDLLLARSGGPPILPPLPPISRVGSEVIPEVNHS